jgi:hypothetical protein
MNQSPSTPSKSVAYLQLPDVDMDCARSNCTGWLRVFGNAVTLEPIYIQCSNKDHKVAELRCSKVTMFSRKESKCSVCEAKIIMKDIITQNWDNQWVHYTCAQSSIQPSNVYAICLRCTGEIATESDAVPSSVGTSEGFIHVKCSNRGKKRARHSSSSQEGGTDDEFASSSQESR